MQEQSPLGNNESIRSTRQHERPYRHHADDAIAPTVTREESNRNKEYTGLRAAADHVIAKPPRVA